MPMPMPNTGRRRLATISHEQPVEIFAAGVNRANAGMQHEAVAARVEIGASDEQHAVDQVEHAAQIGFVPRRGAKSAESLPL